MTSTNLTRRSSRRFFPDSKGLKLGAKAKYMIPFGRDHDAEADANDSLYSHILDAVDS